MGTDAGRDDSSSVAAGAKNKTEPQQRVRTTSNRALGPGCRAWAPGTGSADTGTHAAGARTGRQLYPKGWLAAWGLAGAGWRPREARTCGWRAEAAGSGSFRSGDSHPFVW